MTLFNYMYFGIQIEASKDFGNSRPSHTTTETTKNVVIVHTHYNFFAQLQRFFQQFYIWTTIFTAIFFAKIFAVLCVVCNGVKAPYCN